MKNTIILNLNDFSCDCLSAVNDGSNSITIEARKGDFSDPHILLTLAGGAQMDSGALQPNGGIISYTIPEKAYDTSGDLLLQITDGGYRSSVITITGAANESGNNLTLEEKTETHFICIVAMPMPTGGAFTEEWQAAINANTAARHSHSNKGALDVIETYLTNIELEKLLTL